MTDFQEWLTANTQPAAPWDDWPEEACEEIRAVLDHNRLGGVRISMAKMVDRLRDAWEITTCTRTLKAFAAREGRKW